MLSRVFFVFFSCTYTTIVNIYETQSRVRDVFIAARPHVHTSALAAQEHISRLITSPHAALSHAVTCQAFTQLHGDALLSLFSRRMWAQRLIYIDLEVAFECMKKMRICEARLLTTRALQELPGSEAAGLIGRVWIWKPNKLPRKAPKIAERKIHPKTEKTPGVIPSISGGSVLICKQKLAAPLTVNGPSLQSQGTG